MLSLVKASLSKRQDEGYKSCELDKWQARELEIPCEIVKVSLVSYKQKPRQSLVKQSRQSLMCDSH